MDDKRSGQLSLGVLLDRVVEKAGVIDVAVLFERGFCLVDQRTALSDQPVGGIDIAAVEGAKIGLPEMDLGTVPAWGGSARLTRCVGRDHALDMILRGLKISGPRAREIGLVTEVVPMAALKARGLELAQELAAMPRLAVKSMMECIVGTELRTLEESLADERAAVHATFGSADAAEGLQAFLQKRKPIFNR